MNEWLDDFRTAVAFLTRLPMPHPDGAMPPNFVRAQRMFPVVGALIGAAVGLLCLGLRYVGVPDLAAAALALGGSAILTGALHEDGLADVADGFGGGRTLESKLEIMRDSRLGTYGAVGLLVSFAAKLSTALETRFETGGVTEAAIRALIYIRLASSTVDERGFSILKAVRSMRPAAERLHLAELKDLFRNQFLLVKLDGERAIGSIPRLLPESREQRQAALDVVQRIANARGENTPDEERRLQRVKSLFGGISLVTQTQESARA